ncbi:MAG: heavy metal translocating P-type ATPase [Candidatus Lokiarchaeota archaeon]|nr:heavy metal translocating P-type ATPase [Candidatus Lokiarchaeota archaeon]MBD3199562.1 heavy metal translocating P-type ATPase [Candidatus Lokiarchaeota archaeon]
MIKKVFYNLNDFYKLVKMNKDSPSCSHCAKIEMDYHHEESFFENYFWYFIGSSGFLILFAILIEFFLDFIILSQIFALLSISLSSFEVFEETLEDIKNKRITANLLMIIAAIASFFIFHGQEGATAILLYAIAEHLEEITTEKSRNAIGELLELVPDEAFLKKGNEYAKVPSEQIKEGDIIGIKPAMKVPLDGLIISGQSYFDEAAITGESVPVFKKEGDEVFAGSFNSESFVELEVIRESTNTIVAQIAKSIEIAQQNKSKKEKFIQKFSRYYTPSIIIAALLVIIIPSLFFGLNFRDWFYRGLILLVVSCPCALTLSTPLANVVALTKLAKEGILVKGNKFIELVNDIQTFAFDKTGTLTEGKLKVFDIIAYENKKDEVLRLTSSLERLSEHPIGHAIVNYAQNSNIEFYEVKDFEILKGKGIRGKIDEQIFQVGSERFFTEKDFNLPVNNLDEMKEEGLLPILLGTEQKILGIITIRDVMRVTAPILINGLKKRGYSTSLISGDTQKACDTIGGCLDVDNIEGNLLPNQKIERIHQIQNTSKKVAMVGDGINDAPALASSDLGIAIGASATDLTLETADIVIMNDDLTKLLTFVDITKKTNSIIKQNIWTSIIVKLSFAILTVLGLMTLFLAVGIGDMGVSLFVLFNGMRILRYKSEFQEISLETLENNVKTIICQNCKTKNTLPQHHGRDMIKRDDKLVCWRKLIDHDQLKPCEEEMPLYCPKCQAELKIH